MFDHAEVSERHAAIGVFTAIALGGAAAFELLITGGFAPILPPTEGPESRTAPLQVQVVDRRAPDVFAYARVTPARFTMDEPAALDDWGAQEASYAEAELAGAAGSRRAASYERSYADIERDIDALYHQTARYRDAEPAHGVTTTLYAENSAKKDEAETGAVTVYGSASPW